MKIRLLLSCLLTWAVLTTAQAHTPFKVIARDAFIHIKVPRELMGASIQLRDSSGQVVKTIRVDHQKVRFDLFELRDGTYNVDLHHNDVVIQFSFVVESSERHGIRHLRS
jgi:hypothetical protein